MSDDLVVVVGAAGHQGEATLRHLRERGLAARALFDERDSRRAQPPWSSDADTLTARLDEAATIEPVLSHASSLFVVLDDPGTGPSDRLEYGRALGEAAARAGVGHVVYSTATGPDHHRVACDLGSEIEQRLRALDLPLTVLRPATVMEEVPWYWLSQFAGKLILATPFVPTNHLPLVAIDDLGGLAALAFSEPEAFTGKTIHVAGDVATPLDIASMLAEQLAEPVEYSEVQVEGVFVYQEASTPVHDIPWLRRVYPRLHTLQGWFEECGGRQLCERAVGLRAA